MLILLLLVVGIFVALGGLVGWRRRQRALAKAAGAPVDDASAERETTRPAPGALARWLLRAGFSQANAGTLFVTATAVCLLAGIAAGRLSRIAIAPVAATMRDLPGGVGELMLALLDVLPWLLGLEVTAAPALFVRTARRRRVQAVEQDLPLVLELLATMAQAGLALDAALARVVAFQPPARPLTIELRHFQRDLLVGIPRLSALRNLAERNDVTSLSLFVAAVIQTEQIGASIGETLRFQADDVRARRREQALLLAQALPVKLVVPLVVCFLPGIFLSTLGPVLNQMIQVADSVLRR